MAKLTKELSIEGMRCIHCAEHTKDALKNVKGVKKVEVSLENKKATLEMSDKVVIDDLIKAVEELGFKVVDIK